MQRSVRKLGVLTALILVLAVASLSLASAQSLPSVDPPPPFQPVDGNGVDLVSGQFSVAAPTLVIGQQGAGGLTYQRTLMASGMGLEWKDNYDGKIVRNCQFELPWGCAQYPWYYGVSADGLTSVTFASVNNVYTPVFGQYATLTAGSPWVYTAPDGSVATYTTIGAGRAYITSVTKPNGEVITYHYNSATSTVRRLQSVTNNYGYQLHFEYVSDNYNSANPNPWRTVVKVVGINNAVEYCGPTANTCSLSNPWPTLTFGVATNEFNVTDSLGRVTRIFTTDIPCAGYCVSNKRITGVRRPTSSSGQDVTLTYTTPTAPDYNAKVVTFSNGVGTWTYSFTGDPALATVTDPLNHVTKFQSTYDYVMAGPNEPPIMLYGGFVYVENALDQRTTFTWGGSSLGFRITDVAYPEGNKVHFSYDARGNITERRAISKTPNTPADIVTSATYPSSCSNLKTCNKPTTYTDARGNTTNFTYDSAHGGMLTMTSPAVGGVSPQTRWAYAQKYAWYKNSGGSIVQATSPVWRPTETSQCQTQSSCSGQADEVLTTTAYQVGSSSVASNVLPISVTSGSGNGTLAATTLSTYTNLGDLATVDGPRTDVTDVVTYRYDVWRQKVGEILADPDGGGPLLRPATRTTYNADGQVTAVDRGTVTGTSDGNWAAFSTLESKTTSYNSRGLKERDNVLIGGVTQSVTQYSYDAASRLDCIAIRMNPAVFGSLPSSACTLGTQGANGPDRIAKNGYDAADRVLTVKNAVGTGIEQTTVTNAYTVNGKRDWVEDANGNRSDFTYDGHDRLIKLNFPPTTVGAHAANSSDYEEYGYDPAGNMTSKRLRSGETISFTYDVLNRETVKDIPGGTAQDVYSGYDLLGRKLFAKFVSTSGDGVAYTYDALARILSETSYGRALTFQYDLASNRTRVTYPDANYIQTTYDVLNRAQEVRENGATSGAGLLALYAYDNLLRRTSVTFGNGTAETFTYANSSRNWSLAQNLAGTSQDVTLSFTLSPAPQIMTRDISNSAYGYTPPTLSKSYTANGLNQYTGVGGATFTNDARGNLTSDGSRTFAYDLENHLTSVSGSASMTLGYDPLGRLRETVSGSATTQYLYDGDRLVAEYDGSNNLLRRYAFGVGVDEPLVWYESSDLTDRRTHHADNQGSIIATSDGSGVGTIQTYGPYGEPASWSGSRFKYTGQIALPEVSLYHYKARVYDPSIGRLLQTDPLGYNAGPLNLYAYVENDPINLVDPTGLYVCHGGEDQCKVIREALTEIEKAREGLKKGSKEDKALKDILDFYGEEGKKNGVNVGFRSSGALGMARMRSKEHWLTFNLKRFSDFDNRAGVNAVVERAGVVAHEGQHGIDNQLRGREPTTSWEAYQSERNAFRTQSYVNQGAGAPSTYGIWQPGISDAERNYYININAVRATKCDLAGGICPDE